MEQAFNAMPAVFVCEICCCRRILTISSANAVIAGAGAAAYCGTKVPPMCRCFSLKLIPSLFFLLNVKILICQSAHPAIYGFIFLH